MTKRIKLLICILLALILVACINKRKDEIENQLIITDKQTTVKSCLITNNFYSDQCIETNTIDYKNINYIELYYKYDIDFNFLEETDITTTTKTSIIIEQNSKEIYNEKIELTNYNDIRLDSSTYQLENSTKLYPDMLVQKINQYLEDNYLDKTTTNSYIKTIVYIEAKNKIDKTPIVEFIATVDNETINVTTNYLTQ